MTTFSAAFDENFVKNDNKSKFYRHGIDMFSTQVVVFERHDFQSSCGVQNFQEFTW